MRRVSLLVAMIFVLGACSSAGLDSDVSSAAGEPGVTLDQAEPSPRESGPSALDDPTADGLPRPLVDVDAIVSGGPAPDGIPAIDKPTFVRPAQATFVRDNEPVLALDVNGDTRAYPVQILIWHEIVNDTVGGVPVAVTYCPLCNSAIAYDRRAAGRILDFGTSGKLYNSDLVAYDRQTQSLWIQLLGQAVAGRLTGTQLDALPVATVSFATWRDAHPDGWVLSRDTGFARDYGRNPYPGYDDVRTSPFLFDKPVNGRLPAKTRVVGLRDGDDAVAITLDRLRRDRVVTVTLAGQAIVVLWVPGTVSSLDADAIADGTDVGATGAFVAAIDGRELRLSAAGDGFTDADTSSTWDVLGRATRGPRMGETLTRVVHVDTFWFAWAAFLPATRVEAT